MVNINQFGYTEHNFHLLNIAYIKSISDYYSPILENTPEFTWKYEYKLFMTYKNTNHLL